VPVNEGDRRLDAGKVPGYSGAKPDTIQASSRKRTSLRERACSDQSHRRREGCTYENGVVPRQRFQHASPFRRAAGPRLNLAIPVLGPGLPADGGL